MEKEKTEIAIRVMGQCMSKTDLKSYTRMILMKEYKFTLSEAQIYADLAYQWWLEAFTS